jgi:ABC-type nitrate/sulfonate/bicarbonate transport system substrate-binding protein
MTQINSIFVPPDSDIDGVADLRGRTVGVPRWESGTATYIRAMIYDAFGFDIRAETDSVEADPLSLWDTMTKDDDLDAMIQFTGFTVKGLANPDSVRSIFDAWEFWADRTGHPPLITPWTTHRDWLEANWGVASRILSAWENTQRSVRENAGQVVDQYGRLAGLTDPKDKEAVVQLARDGALTCPVAEFDASLVDSQWQLLEAMAAVGSIPAVPPREDHVYTASEVHEKAAE